MYSGHWVFGNGWLFKSSSTQKCSIDDKVKPIFNMEIELKEREKVWKLFSGSMEMIWQYISPLCLLSEVSKKHAASQSHVGAAQSESQLGHLGHRDRPFLVITRITHVMDKRSYFGQPFLNGVFHTGVNIDNQRDWNCGAGKHWNKRF